MSEELEERLAFLERQSDEMSDEIARLAQIVDRLSNQVGLLVEREVAREAEETGGVILGDEKPPHY